MEICIVDDDRVYQLLMKKLIRRIDPDISVRAFFDGKEALQYYKTNRCNCQILLLDINMPEMDGWEFLENITKKEFKEPSIYLATSSIAYSDRERAKKYDKIKGYLTKPITKEKIIEITQC